MVTLKQTLKQHYDWALDRIHFLCEDGQPNQLTKMDYADAIHAEFQEWLEPNSESKILSLEYIEDVEDCIHNVEI